MNIHKRGDLDRNDNGTRKKSVIRVLEKVVIGHDDHDYEITRRSYPRFANREVIIQILRVGF